MFVVVSIGNGVGGNAEEGVSLSIGGTGFVCEKKVEVTKIKGSLRLAVGKVLCSVPELEVLMVSNNGK